MNESSKRNVNNLILYRFIITRSSCIKVHCRNIQHSCCCYKSSHNTHLYASAKGHKETIPKTSSYFDNFLVPKPTLDIIMCLYSTIVCYALLSHQNDNLMHSLFPHAQRIPSMVVWNEMKFSTLNYGPHTCIQYNTHCHINQAQQTSKGRKYHLQ